MRCARRYGTTCHQPQTQRQVGVQGHASVHSRRAVLGCGTVALRRSGYGCKGVTAVGRGAFAFGEVHEQLDEAVAVREAWGGGEHSWRLLGQVRCVNTTRRHSSCRGRRYHTTSAVRSHYSHSSSSGRHAETLSRSHALHAGTHLRKRRTLHVSSPRLYTADSSYARFHGHNTWQRVDRP